MRISSGRASRRGGKFCNKKKEGPPASHSGRFYEEGLTVVSKAHGQKFVIGSLAERGLRISRAAASVAVVGKFVALFGSWNQCPRGNSMNAAENYFKAACTKCGVNVETPNELYDTIVDCPDCGERFLARPPVDTDGPPRYVPYQKPIEGEKGLPLFVYAIAGAILLLGGLVYVVSEFGDDLAGIAGGTAELVAIIALACLAGLVCILWIMFPVFMYYGMRRHEKLLQQIEANTRKRPTGAD